MAREEEFKRIDLKVNVSCCEGCRRKVMKAMSLKGVLRTEIQPSHDRVAVVGDVDAKVLVKKLAKIGKIAEVLPPASEDGNRKRDDSGGKKDGDRSQAEERSRGKDDGKSGAGDKAKADGKQECKKCCAHEAARADGDNGDHAHASGKARATAAKCSEEGGDGDGFGAKSLAPDRHAAPIMQQHYHRAEPPMAVPAFYAPTPAPYYGYYGMPPPPPPPPMPMPPMGLGVPRQLRPQPSRFDEDFFNDDNTVGCRVM